MSEGCAVAAWVCKNNSHPQKTRTKEVMYGEKDGVVNVASSQKE
jgi:hypothetical protein